MECVIPLIFAWPNNDKKKGSRADWPAGKIKIYNGDLIAIACD
jgi:hypothetical protein